MKEYKKPLIKLQTLDAVDIITSSGIDLPEVPISNSGIDLPEVPIKKDHLTSW